MAKEILHIDSARCTGCGLCVDDCIRGRLGLDGQKISVNEAIPCMECGHCLAVCPANACALDGYDRGEVVEYSPEAFGLSADNLLNFIKFRRSIRHFTADAVDEELLRQGIEAGRFTPTAANRQNLRYIILREKLPEIREVALKALHDIAMNHPDSDDTSLSLYRARWIENYELFLHRRIDRLFWDAPSAILVVGSSQGDKWIDLNAGLAANSLSLMLGTKGLGSCFIGFFSVATELHPPLKTALGMTETERVLAALAVGYPKIAFRRTTVRKPAKIDIL